MRSINACAYGHDSGADYDGGDADVHYENDNDDDTGDDEINIKMMAMEGR